MKKEMIVRAWKDPEFRASLTPEQRAELPESPSGRPLNELGEDALADVVGGFACVAPGPAVPHGPMVFTRGRGCITEGSLIDACPIPTPWGPPPGGPIIIVNPITPTIKC